MAGERSTPATGPPPSIALAQGSSTRPLPQPSSSSPPAADAIEA
jgi:hypothetical protein